MAKFNICLDIKLTKNEQKKIIGRIQNSASISLKEDISP